MAIAIKTDQEIAYMRISGKILAEVLEECCKIAKVGMSTYELDQIAENLIRQKGGIPAFKGFHGYPSTFCTSVNEAIVHSIPRKDQILKEGDLLTLDSGVIYKGMYTDAARSIGIGKISDTKKRLIETANKALSQAIDIVKPGIHLCEISKSIQKTVEGAGFRVIYDLTGHGIGHNLHEDPVILNYYDGNQGPVLKQGMTLAIEPIFSVGTNHLKTLKDKWTIVTADGSDAVQAENTILITQNGTEILTL